MYLAGGQMGPEPIASHHDRMIWLLHILKYYLEG